MKTKYLIHVLIVLSLGASLVWLVKTLPLQAVETTKASAVVVEHIVEENYTIQEMIKQFSRDEEGQLKPEGFTQAEVDNYFDSAMAVMEDFSDHTRIMAVKGGGFIDKGDLSDAPDTLVNVGSENQPDYRDLLGPDAATVGEVKSALYAVAVDK